MPVVFEMSTVTNLILENVTFLEIDCHQYVRCV